MPYILKDIASNWQANLAENEVRALVSACLVMETIAISQGRLLSDDYEMQALARRYKNIYNKLKSAGSS